MITEQVYLFPFLFGLACSQLYYSNGVRKKWNYAKSDCEIRGMELAILDTATKHQDAKDYMLTQSGNNMPNDVLIGLSLDTTVSYPPYSYIYTNGLVPTYLPWGSAGEPDNQATDFCIRLARKSSLGFHTISCGSSYDYLCSSEVILTPSTTTSTTTSMTTSTAVITTTSAARTTRKKFEGTIFVSGAVIGIAIGFGSLAGGICLCCVLCRLWRGSNDKDDELKQSPEKNNTVIPAIQPAKFPPIPRQSHSIFPRVIITFDALCLF